MTQADTGGLTEFEQQFSDLFEAGKVTLPGQFVNEAPPEDDPADTETATEIEDEIEPAEEESEGAEEDAEADEQGGEEASDEGGDEEAGGGEDEPSALASTALTPPDPNDPNYSDWWDEHIAAPDAPVTIGGVTFSPEQAVDLQRAYAFASTLGPNDVTAINALLSGEYRLVPAADLGAPQSPQSAAGQAVPPTPAPTAEADDDYEPLDPVVAARVAAMEAEMAVLRSQSAQQQQLAAAEAVRQTSESWAEEHGYDPAVRARLEQTVFDNGWMKVFYDQTGDVSRATRGALELAAQSDPQLRQLEIDRLAMEQADRVRAETKQTSAKKRKAGSLGGAGGSVNRGVRAPSTNEERQAAMVAEIASLVGSGQDA